MRALAFALKTLREALREKQIALLFLLFPAFLCLVYFAAFGSGRVSDWLRAAYADLDGSPGSAALVAALRDARMGEGPALGLVPIGGAAGARAMAEEGQAAVGLVIERGYGAALASGGPAAAAPYLRLDYSAAAGNSAIAADVVRACALAAGDGSRPGSRPIAGAGAGAGADAGADGARAGPVPVAYAFSAGTGGANDFLLGVPGILSFGVLFACVSSALLLAREHEKGGLVRLAMAPRAGAPMLLGFALANVALCLGQALLALATARALGFVPRADLLPSLAALLLLSLAALGGGFLAAAFSRGDPQALTISTVLFAGGAFLSDSIFPMPPLLPFTLLGAPLDVKDFLAPYQATQAMKEGLVYGRGPGAALGPLLWLAALASLSLLIGGWAYARRRLRPFTALAARPLDAPCRRPTERAEAPVKGDAHVEGDARAEAACPRAGKE